MSFPLNATNRQRIRPTLATHVPDTLYPSPSKEEQHIVQGKNERILCLGFFENGDLHRWVRRDAKISRHAIDSIQKCASLEIQANLHYSEPCYLIHCKGTLWLVAYQATGAALWDEEDSQSVSDAIGKLVEQVTFMPGVGSEYHAAQESFAEKQTK